MPKINYPYLVGIDWLTIYCKLTSAEFFKLEHNTSEFISDISNYPTANYLYKCVVSEVCGNKKVPFCEILFGVKSSVLPPSSCHLRILNHQLYTSTWYYKLRRFLVLAHLQYVSITRLDIYADFNKFKFGLKPVTLIQNYIKARFLKVGINNGYLAFRSMGYAIGNGATRLSKDFHVNAPDINAITWGRKGYIQTQLYNKTLEIKTVKYKPWIVKSWEAAGLDIENVWRLEFRIQKAAKGVKLLDCNELFALGHGEISDNRRVLDLYLAYVDKYARFVKRDYHVKKQQMEPVQLFGIEPGYQNVIKPKIAPCSTAFGRTTKIVTNYLEHLQNEITAGRIPTTDPEAVWHLWHAAQTIRGNLSAFIGKNKARMPSDIVLLEQMEAKRLPKQLNNAGPLLFNGAIWKDLEETPKTDPARWIV